MSSHAEKVSAYYDVHTEPFYIGPDGWDPEHIHFGIFLERPDAEYQANPMLVLQDRRPSIDRMTSAILGPAKIKASDVVVDAGCGVGGTTILVNKEHGSRAIGLNINSKQLEIARERAKEAGVEDMVTFQFADCSRSLPFEDGSVDVIINIESACHYADRETFIAEAARVLKPGGRIVAQDWMAANGISAGDKKAFLDPLCATWFLGDLDSLDSYTKMLTEAGFEVKEAEHIEDGILPNGYLIGMGYMGLLQKEQAMGLTEYEQGNKGRLKSFADSLLAGKLKIGRYYAVKK
jgi:ubiquinone/menaquinone biosynthesis C-methylase UbiE